MRPAALALLLAVAPGAARADELEFRPVRDGVITGVAALTWLGTGILLANRLAPSRCDWCAANGFDDGIRGSLRWDDRTAAGRISDAGAYVVIPSITIGLVGLAAAHDDRPGEYWTDAGLVLESMAVAGVVQQGVKLFVARQRPDIHALTPDVQAAVQLDAEPNLSFYSGHSSIAFAFAVSSGTVATLRRRRLAPLVWAAGLSLAATTAYLRIAADRHWASDVLTGAAMGSLSGFLIPWLHRRHVEVRIAPGTVGVGGSF
jgi:membrane-associated phospholipid phosphatase